MSITTEEQRRQLEAAGWALTDDVGMYEDWRHPQTGMEMVAVLPADAPGPKFYPAGGLADRQDLQALVAALSILQIPIPGYRIIREEGAEGGS